MTSLFPTLIPDWAETPLCRYHILYGCALVYSGTASYTLVTVSLGGTNAVLVTP